MDLINRIKYIQDVKSIYYIVITQLPIGRNEREKLLSCLINEPIDNDFSRVGYNCIRQSWRIQ